MSPSGFPCKGTESTTRQLSEGEQVGRSRLASSNNLPSWFGAQRLAALDPRVSDAGETPINHRITSHRGSTRVRGPCVVDGCGVHGRWMR